MGKYEADLAKVVGDQQELVNAEKLLDLPVSVHPELISIQKDMEGLRQIYDIYKAQKVGYCGSQLKLHIMQYIILFFQIFHVFHGCSLNMPGCKDKMVSDLVGGFKHPRAAGWC